MDADHVVQVAERALFDAEHAYRLDPSVANQRRVMKAWYAVRKAREQQRAVKADAAQPPAALDD